MSNFLNPLNQGRYFLKLPTKVRMLFSIAKELKFQRLAQLMTSLVLQLNFSNMDIWVRCSLGGLVPMYDTDLENKKKLKVGSEYLVSVKMPRNIRFHRKIFALYNLVFQNQETYRFLDDLRRDITIEAGF